MSNRRRNRWKWLAEMACQKKREFAVVEGPKLKKGYRFAPIGPKRRAAEALKNEWE
jgi:hypothetical protein